MLPLLRTIILILKNGQEKTLDNKRRRILLGFEEKITKIFGALLRNTKLTFDCGFAGAKLGTYMDLGRVIDEYKSNGTFIQDQKRFYFHEHVSDYLKEEFEKILKWLG